MKTATALAFAAGVLAGCAATGDSTSPVTSSPTSPTSDNKAPMATAAGTSPISPDRQEAFCRDQVAFMHGAKPKDVAARERVVAADGSTTIDATVDKGSEGAKTFKCRLDASNRFIDVIAATSDGAL
jgi:hypothetical protein